MHNLCLPPTFQLDPKYIHLVLLHLHYVVGEGLRGNKYEDEQIAKHRTVWENLFPETKTKEYAGNGNDQGGQADRDIAVVECSRDLFQCR